jgi:hypothetical protein
MILDIKPSLIQSASGFKIKLIFNDEQLIGFIGYMIKNGIIYAPLLGYELNSPNAKGIYRMISALKINAAQEFCGPLDSSAGASSFKRNRGHTPIIEYHGAYIVHLSLLRKIMWKFMIFVVNKFAMPLIEHRGL